MKSNIELARRNLPEPFVRLLYSLLNQAYARAKELAESEFSANQAHMAGQMRWALSNDALYSAASRTGMRVERIRIQNGQAHTLVRAVECVLLIKKVQSPGQTGTAEYRNFFAENNRQLSLFGDDLVVPEVSPNMPVLFELTHGSNPLDKLKLDFINVVIPDGNGGKIDYFPLDSIYPGLSDSDDCVETIPDLVGPTPIGVRKTAQ